MNEQVGEIFQEKTKYSRTSTRPAMRALSSPPGTYKVYPSHPVVELPPPGSPAQNSLDTVLRKRMSVREYLDRPLFLAQVSYLLWATNGLLRQSGGHGFRTVPSAGALYPLETYLVANRVADLPSGVYHYSVREHRLSEIRRGDFRQALSNAGLGQEMLRQAGAVFIWTAVFGRSRWKYGERAYRYVYLDAGHSAQNLALAACALDLGTCQIGALFDSEVNDLVGVDGHEESVLYMSTVGYPTH
ncbi:MAG TPA: SagB/ThcOx family dehydrogenase [Atribacteraceae bacterium]|nr:SagB/ThcOx family dehydrogenase [Atribacteraceae bacterium]